MLDIGRDVFTTLEAYADILFPKSTLDQATIREFSSNKVLSLLELLRQPEVRGRKV